VREHIAEPRPRLDFGEALAHDFCERVDAVAHVGRYDAEVHPDRGGEELQGSLSASNRFDRETMRRIIDSGRRRMRTVSLRTSSTRPRCVARESGVGACGPGVTTSTNALDECWRSLAARRTELTLPSARRGMAYSAGRREVM